MKRILVITLLTLALPVVTMVSASEESDQYAYGRIIKVSSQLLVLSEINYDSEDEGEIEVDYFIDSETVFENFKSMVELLVNDEVEIIFVKENGLKKVKRIAKIDEYQWDEDLEEVQEDSRV